MSSIEVWGAIGAVMASGVGAWTLIRTEICGRTRVWRTSQQHDMQRIQLLQPLRPAPTPPARPLPSDPYTLHTTCPGCGMYTAHLLGTVYTAYTGMVWRVIDRECRDCGHRWPQLLDERRPTLLPEVTAGGVITVDGHELTVPPCTDPHGSRLDRVVYLPDGSGPRVLHGLTSRSAPAPPPVPLGASSRGVLHVYPAAVLQRIRALRV